MGAPLIWGGSNTSRLLQRIFNINGNAHVITGDTDNPTLVAKNAPLNSLYLRSGTTGIFMKTDSGSSTNWTQISSSSPIVREIDGTPSITANTIEFTNTTVSDQGGGVARVAIPIITNWTSITFTGSWTTNTTYTAYEKRVGDSASYRGRLSLAGAPNSAIFTLTMPSGRTIDTTKLPGFSVSDGYMGKGMIQSGSGRFGVTLIYNSTTTFTVRVNNSSGTYDNLGTDVTQAVPVTFASGDSISFELNMLPISEFA